jgi:hypothetical protein
MMLSTGRVCRAVLIGLTIVATASGQAPPAKHAFAARDWAALRSARAAAVAPDGTILYQVGFGAERGPSQSEWWTIAPDGRHAARLGVAEDFSPAGFISDGSALYGAWNVNKLRQLAVFSIADHKAAAVPKTLVLLPRGMESAIASPDGKSRASTW